MRLKFKYASVLIFVSLLALLVLGNYFLCQVAGMKNFSVYLYNFLNQKTAQVTQKSISNLELSLLSQDVRAMAKKIGQYISSNPKSTLQELFVETPKLGVSTNEMDVSFWETPMKGKEDYSIVRSANNIDATVHHLGEPRNDGTSNDGNRNPLSPPYPGEINNNPEAKFALVEINTGEIVFGNLTKDEAGLFLKDKKVFYGYVEMENSRGFKKPYSVGVELINARTSDNKGIFAFCYMRPLILGNVFEDLQGRIYENTQAFEFYFNRYLKNVFGNFLYIMIALIIAFVALGIVIAIRLVKPFLELVKQTEEIGFGKLDFKINIKSKDEIGRLASTINIFAFDIKKNIEDLKQSTVATERMQNELDIAKDIQQSFLPEHEPNISDKFEIYAENIPAMEVSGDFYDFIPVSQNKWGLVIADVSGKGVPAALFMALTKTLLRSCSSEDLSLPKIIQKTNRFVIADSKNSTFVTVFYAMLDTLNSKINFVSAGHNPPILFKKNKKEIVLLEMKGMALGVYDGIELEESEAVLEKGDILVMYTDGVTEAINDNQEMFGVERLKDVVREFADYYAIDIMKAIYNAVKKFSGNQPQFDDITVMVVKVKNDERSKHMKIELTVEIVNDLKEIERLSKVIDEFGEKNGIHSKAVFEVNLSLEELITNTVSYGYNDGAVHKIIVSLIYSNDILEIEIRDDGLAFNPLNKGNPDTKQSIEERQIGGLGIYFVRNYVEELFYKRENEFNVLTLKKKIK